MNGQVSEESDFDGALEPVLDEVFAVAELEGLAVLDTASVDGGLRVIHRVGLGGARTISDGQALLLAHPGAPAHRVAPDYRPIIACPWILPPARFGGLILWRAPGARAWRNADHALVAAVGALVRTIVTSGVGQIGIDRLTGLPNRRWFIDEVDRHLDRLELDGRVGTLSVIDVGGLAKLEATEGREAGNTILVRLAAQLRTMVRPGDAVARVAADRFAVWQPAMDHLTAAERADALCGMQLFPDLPAGWGVTLSIGIVACGPLGGEDTRGLLRRAQAAVEQVKALGSGGWRVSRATPLLPGAGSHT